MVMISYTYILSQGPTQVTYATSLGGPLFPLMCGVDHLFFLKNHRTQQAVTLILIMIIIIEIIKIIRRRIVIVVIIIKIIIIIIIIIIVISESLTFCGIN